MLEALGCLLVIGVTFVLGVYACIWTIGKKAPDIHAQLKERFKKE